VDGSTISLKVRSMVGLSPLLACEVLEDAVIDKLPGFKKRMMWFIEHRADLARFISYLEGGERPGRRLLAVPSRDKLLRVVRVMLDEKEFLSPHGLRSMSAVHREHPCVIKLNGREFQTHYAPGESDTDLFGGNSNWRGPVWFPLNYLLIESLEKYHHYYGDSFQVECPAGSGQMLNLQQVSHELSRRLVSLFCPDSQTGRRPYENDNRPFAQKSDWRDLILFHEFFDGDTGRGLGSSHQTGWTALVAHLLEHLARGTPDVNEHAADTTKEAQPAPTIS
jgi:hypothetical protein